MSKKEEKSSEVLPQKNIKAGVSIANPSGAARRRLLRAIGGSGSVAVGAIMTSQWQKPVIEAVILPAHAQTSIEPVANCPITVNVGSFSQSSPQAYTLSVYVSNGSGTTVMNELISSGFASVSLSGSSTFPVGAYGAGMAFSRGASANYGFAYTASCCSATLNANGGGIQQNLDFPLSLVIPDDGQCSFR